jgi:putative PIG3 family NAD(P)H quinone oxidoreductase
MITVPASMRAVIAPRAGGLEALTVVERPLANPAADEILIAVRAAGLNRADILQRLGKYPPPPGASDILGMEVAGEVAAVGDTVTAFRIGDRVMTLVAGGGYAEFCPAPAAVALPLPDALSFTEGAAVPEAFFTVWLNVFRLGGLKAKETALIHGGSSGIGTAAIQLAKAFGARVIVTAGSPEKCAACRALGADVAINYRTEDFVAAVLTATAGRGADVILDMVGGEYVGRNYAAAAADGRIVQIATQAGSRADIDLRALMAKRLVHTGSTLRSRPVAFKAALAEDVRANCLPLLASGKVRPVIDSTFPLANVAEAHRRLESSAHIGKIVLTIDR